MCLYSLQIILGAVPVTFSIFPPLIPYGALCPETRESLTKGDIIRRPLMRVQIGPTEGQEQTQDTS